MHNFLPSNSLEQRDIASNLHTIVILPALKVYLHFKLCGHTSGLQANVIDHTNRVSIDFYRQCVNSIDGLCFPFNKLYNLLLENVFLLQPTHTARTGKITHFFFSMWSFTLISNSVSNTDFVSFMFITPLNCDIQGLRFLLLGQKYSRIAHLERFTFLCISSYSSALLFLPLAAQHCESSRVFLSRSLSSSACFKLITIKMKININKNVCICVFHSFIFFVTKKDIQSIFNTNGCLSAVILLLFF